MLARGSMKAGEGAANSNDRPIFLVAPNVSEQMGGEAMKALQIFCAFKKLNPNTIQITHERCEAELSGRLKLDDVYYVRDTPLAVFLWRSKIFRRLLDVWFSAKAVKMADRMASSKGEAGRFAVVHQTEPNSPVTVRSLSRVCYNAIGPINGNIYYPELFRRGEGVGASLRRKLHFPLQRLSKILFPRAKRVDLVFAAGGERTVRSLIAAGYSAKIIKTTIDCGIPDDVVDRPKIAHTQQNFHFVHYGRLVYHKGTWLAIESLKQADDRVTLDIIGNGPELERCQRLVRELRLDKRVRFLPWFESHHELLDALRKYRGMVLPTFQDANGIVVQEALAIGLPPICLNWGGPQLLIEHGVSGFLIDPTSAADITAKIAEALDRLSREPELAERMSVAGRARAETWRWSRVAREWTADYASADAAAWSMAARP